MGPAEIVASLQQLCEEKGPRLTTEQIVDWIEYLNGFESDAELIAFAKKMKARQYARLLEYDDPDYGRRFKRLWSFRDKRRNRRFYSDITQLPAAERRRLLEDYIKFAGQLRSVRRAMNDALAGQNFFEFYGDDDAPVDEPAVAGA
jgi:hypothetical protein